MMRHYQLKFLTLLRMILFNFVIGNAQMTPEFLDHPMSINTIDGTTVEFTCTANNNPVILIFSINNNGVPTQNGFRELPEVLDIGGGVKRKRLKVTASANNNNSSIICRAYYDNDLKSVSSDEAILLVQGPLSSVVDLSDSFINASTVNISWSPPFTLPGTEITGYNISVISNGTTTNYFTSDSYYELLLTDEMPCNITVSGYNRLDGESNILQNVYSYTDSENGEKTLISSSNIVIADVLVTPQFAVNHLNITMQNTPEQTTSPSISLISILTPVAACVIIGFSIIIIVFFWLKRKKQSRQYQTGDSEMTKQENLSLPLQPATVWPEPSPSPSTTSQSKLMNSPPPPFALPLQDWTESESPHIPEKRQVETDSSSRQSTVIRRNIRSNS